MNAGRLPGASYDDGRPRCGSLSGGAAGHVAWQAAIDLPGGQAGPLRGEDR
jgi:hypothetical protein